MTDTCRDTHNIDLENQVQPSMMLDASKGADDLYSHHWFVSYHCALCELQ